MVAQEPTAVKLPLWEPRDAWGRWGSCLLVVGTSLDVEIKEYSDDERRDATRRALDYIVAEVSRILALPKGREDAAYWRMVLPAESLHTRPMFTVKAETPSKFVLTGFVNAGAKGYVRVRALNSLTREMVATEESAATAYVGWSTDQEIFFPFEATVWTDEASSPRQMEFQAWFTPCVHDRLLMVQDWPTSCDMWEAEGP
jgi:hypothetical protein